LLPLAYDELRRPAAQRLVDDERWRGKDAA
jgi:hypothetical protein